MGLRDWLFFGRGARSFPWLLLGYVAVSMYTIFYHLAYYQMYAAVSSDLKLGLLLVHPNAIGTKAGAITIWVVLGFVRLWWLLSWSLAVLQSTAILRDRRQVPRHQAPRRQVMQTAAEYVLLVWDRNRAEALRHQRPRLCGVRGCPSAVQQLGDRVYHCTTLQDKNHHDGGRRPIHLPLYDHTCHWIRVVVYLDTIKAYLLAILFMTLDAVIVLSVSVFAMIRKSTASYRTHGPVALLTTMIIVYLAGSNAFRRWWHIACRNRVIPELAGNSVRKQRFAIFQPTRDGHDYIFGTFEDERRQAMNPWDLGTRANLKAALGGWSCLLFWRQPARVRRYGSELRGLQRSDFEMSEQFWAWVYRKVLEGRERTASGGGTAEAVATPADRRTVARSSGTSNGRETGPVDRRHPRDLTNSDVVGASDAWSIPERRTASDMV